MENASEEKTSILPYIATVNSLVLDFTSEDSKRRTGRLTVREIQNTDHRAITSAMAHTQLPSPLDPLSVTSLASPVLDAELLAAELHRRG